ncbi:leucyl aminopeptidase [Nannizzia gypsea CBS 118893]|uniref:Peptide hydrolase n=1 Tax=Arthroderma gypseum (strain ATCC MYA-4604 / CBS 118893) TaxID=535722 RepID=E4UMK8_ARTGP|nr:leucyl aminopeptidase [Nannizzia gypsea CBS 118893]EFQ99425.1 leucyl aminopeptidase [Nannizzia gypsea CBS 118893]
MKVLAALALSAMAMAKPTPPMPGMSLIQTGPQETRWVTAAEKLDLVMNHVGFFDITDRPETASIAAKPKSYAFPGNVSHQAEVKPLLEKISGDHIKSNLEMFSSYPNRYYNAQSGVESAQWVMEQAQSVVGQVKGATVEMVKHKWMQPSVRVIIPGKSEKIVAVGAHQDSINGNNPQGEAPGADDNGSGSMTILEALTALVSDQKIAGGEATNTLEFHWYAGEEEGLLGSQDIFQDYKQQGKEVVAMLNQDMTGYGETMGIINDNVDAALTTFTKMILDVYTSAKYADSECGYGCSDHASANKAGYPSAFVYEAEFGKDNPAIHSPEDTLDKLDPAKMAEHAKLVVGFAYELAFATL